MCSPSATLRSASITQKGALLCVWYPAVLSVVLVFATATQGLLLDCLGLVARRACILGSHQSLTIGEVTLGRLPTLGHFTDSRQKYIFSVCVGEANLLVLELQP